MLSRSVILSMSVLFSACCSQTYGDAVVEARELMNAPASYDQRSFVGRGVLTLTSEGFFLVPDCGSIRSGETRLLVYLPQIDNFKAVPAEAFGSVVEVSGKFVAGDEKRVNSWHRLLNARFVRRIPESSCPEVKG